MSYWDPPDMPDETCETCGVDAYECQCPICLICEEVGLPDCCEPSFLRALFCWHDWQGAGAGAIQCVKCGKRHCGAAGW